jgi:TolA-binding protein
MRSYIFRAAAAVAAVLAVSGPALAQGQQATPEQRIERMERQLQQVQRQLFPRGRPAETAGFSNEPAATQASVLGLDQRLAGMERQLADTLRQAEETGNRVRQLEAELARVRGDQEQRIAALETAAARAPAASGVPLQPTTANPPPRTTAVIPPRATPGSGTLPGPAGSNPAAADDPAELAYDEGFQLWRQGRFDEALTSLRAFSSAYPRHRRTSWANNLAGRALLDKGEPRAAAEALLANYRTNPAGERAADSLFYLGQALMKLGQPGQACNAYSELDGVFGARMRDELKRLLPPAKAEAKCS